MFTAHVTNTATISSDSTAPHTTAICYRIADTLQTGNIESLTGRLINMLGTRLVATPARALLIDDKEVFLSYDRAVEVVRHRMRNRVAELTRRRG